VGAQLWHHEAPWHSEGAKALRQLQAHFFAENYYLPAYLDERLRNARYLIGYTVDSRARAPDAWLVRGLTTRAQAP
jgi:hypothetical protein